MTTLTLVTVSASDSVLHWFSLPEKRGKKGYSNSGSQSGGGLTSSSLIASTGCLADWEGKETRKAMRAAEQLTLLHCFLTFS